jgi:hypothetical protein
MTLRMRARTSIKMGVGMIVIWTRMTTPPLQREGEFALGRLINKIVSRGRKDRALYGELGTLISSSSNFVDPGAGPSGSVVDDDSLNAWMSITRHVHRPLE